MFKGKTPEVGTGAWRANEKIINKNQVLKDARDVSQGFRPRGSAGEAQKPVSQQYKDNYDRIFRKDKNEKE